ncbi:MAG TPA: acyltransferase [Polyangia bacterium]|nr:acyltransferase [Polyangia bacterium]
MSARPSPLPAHLPALDGLRGVAILLVVAHMLGLLEAPTGLFGRVVGFGFATGWIGVQLFFVLSGFLITGILLDTQGASNYLSGFFARRLLRIFPLYYATLFVALVLVPALAPAGSDVVAKLAHDRAHQVWLWTYLSNWVSPFEAGSHAFPHFWSLAVEEQFYFLWPFVLMGRSARACLRLCVALAVVSLGVRVVMVAMGAPHGAIYTFSITRMDALVLGGAAAALMRTPPVAAAIVARRTRLAPASLVVLVVGALATHGYSLASDLGQTIGYSFLSVGFALAVLSAAASDTAPVRASWLRARPLRALGKYSYGIYVFHKPLHDFVGKALVARLGLDVERSAVVALAYVGAGLAVVFVVAFASYQLFERRFLALKGRFEPRDQIASAS